MIVQYCTVLYCSSPTLLTHWSHVTITGRDRDTDTKTERQKSMYLDGCEPSGGGVGSNLGSTSSHASFSLVADVCVRTLTPQGPDTEPNSDAGVKCIDRKEERLAGGQPDSDSGSQPGAALQDDQCCVCLGGSGLDDSVWSKLKDHVGGPAHTILDAHDRGAATKWWPGSAHRVTSRPRTVPPVRVAACGALAAC